MASTNLSVIVPTLLGTALDGDTVNATAVTSGETVTFSVNTTAGTFDQSSLFIRAWNAASAAAGTLTIGVGTEGSSLGLGTQLLTSVASDTTIYIGGWDFDMSRFQTTAVTIVITATTGDVWYFEAVQAPRALE